MPESVTHVPGMNCHLGARKRKSDGRFEPAMNS
jgi:hypothetical protein